MLPAPGVRTDLARADLPVGDHPVAHAGTGATDLRDRAGNRQGLGHQTGLHHRRHQQVRSDRDGAKRRLVDRSHAGKGQGSRRDEEVEFGRLEVYCLG